MPPYVDTHKHTYRSGREKADGGGSFHPRLGYCMLYVGMQKRKRDAGENRPVCQSRSILVGICERVGTHPCTGQGVTP